MGTVFLIATAVSILAAVVAGVLGFVVYPRRLAHVRKGQKKAHSPVRDQQGLARALFIVFAAAAFTCGFFGLLTR